MELSTIVGLVMAIASILISIFMDHGTIASLINPSAALLIVGGTVGVMILSSTFDDVKRLPKIIGRAFKKSTDDRTALINELVQLAEKSRREGLLSLDESVKDLSHPFLRMGVQTVVDGTDPEETRLILESQLGELEYRHERGIAMLEAGGGYAPTMGIIGTVMGLVHVLGNLSNVGTLGTSIATAFLATFYGIATANVFWLPVAGKLKVLHHAEVVYSQVIIEGVLALQSGMNPRLLRQRLQTQEGIADLNEVSGMASEARL